jgi:hypothetical protein
MTGGVALVACACMITMACAYLLFLAASWNQYQTDRTGRDQKINALLERMPARPAEATE